jgi:hypothetical protein
MDAQTRAFGNTPLDDPYRAREAQPMVWMLARLKCTDASANVKTRLRAVLVDMSLYDATNIFSFRETTDCILGLLSNKELARGHGHDAFIAMLKAAEVAFHKGRVYS